MHKHTEVVELLEIYREMDAEGKKKMVTAASNLLNAQKTLLDQESGTSQFTGIAGYLITGLLLILAICVFWITLINPALLTTGIIPLVMVRIIITALCGMLCIGTGLIRFILKKFTVLWLFLAIGAGILCVDPRVLTDLIGFALVAVIVAVQLIHWKQDKTATTG